MKKIILGLLTMVAVAATVQTHAQSVLIYDQESASGTPSWTGDCFDMQKAVLFQSFIPSLSSIGFAQFAFLDPTYITPPSGNGATVAVRIWEGSPYPWLATCIGTSEYVYMPPEFNNLGFVGLETFYFDTPIALTPGQTYYLQPVVMSGGPWEIMVLGNAGSLIGVDSYPPGQLYVNGSGDVSDGIYIDLWFREGVMVPEPSTFALFGMVCLLLPFIRKRFTGRLGRSFALPFVAGLLFFFAFNSFAETYFFQGAPYPFNPSINSQVTELSPGIYLVQDTATASKMGVQAQTMSAQSVPSLPSPDDPITNLPSGNLPSISYTPLSIDFSGLWLESSNIFPNLLLRLHNPEGENYQLLSTADLLSTNDWILGQILFTPSGSYSDFTPLPMANDFFLQKKPCLI